MSDDMPDFSNVKGGSSSTATKIYVVVSGDSLSKIAKREYGNAKEWKRIFEANTGHPQGSRQDLPGPEAQDSAEGIRGTDE